jgi:DNA invertase Pin-like site-specific DNA recombinase
MSLVGYARISTKSQDLTLQTDALTAAGCEDRIFTDIASGMRSDRPGRRECLTYLREGDTLIVWRLDRFGRSMTDLLTNLDDLKRRGIGFRSLHENIDTTTVAGKLILHIFASFAEFERELIRERTMAGLEVAKAKGHRAGPKKKLNTRQVDLMASLVKLNQPIEHICEQFSISRATLYRYVTPAGERRV